MRKRHLILTGAVSALLLLTGVNPADGAPEKVETGDTKSPAITASIDAAGARAAAFAAEKGALGSYYDTDTKEHVIVLSARSQTTVEEATKAVGARTRLTKFDLTNETVDAVFKRLSSRAFAADAGKYNYGAYLDLQTGRMVLSTDAPDATIAPLQREFPRLIERRVESVQDQYNRKADVQPFWGGASVKSGGGVCSTAFVVKKGSTRVMLTAGHCFSIAANVLTTNGNLSEGIVAQRGPIPPFDMELIAGKSYGSYIFVGGTLSSSGKHVNGAGDPVVGFSNYCRSGQTTGEKCGQKVSSVNAMVCTQTGCKFPVIAYSGGAAGASAPGDSGGPFYVYSVDGSQVYARGMHIAAGGSSSFAEKWSRISSHLGVTIVT